MASALSASYAFMLPVATPPNAIVFSASTMAISDMLVTISSNVFLRLARSMAISQLVAWLGAC